MTNERELQATALKYSTRASIRKYKSVTVKMSN